MVLRWLYSFHFHFRGEIVTICKFTFYIKKIKKNFKNVDNNFLNLSTDVLYGEMHPYHCFSDTNSTDRTNV